MGGRLILTTFVFDPRTCANLHRTSRLIGVTAVRYYQGLLQHGWSYKPDTKL